MRPSTVSSLLSTAALAGGLLLGMTWAEGPNPPPPPPHGMADMMIERRGVTEAAKKEAIKKLATEFEMDMERSRALDEKNLADLKLLVLDKNFDLPALRKNCDDRARLMADRQYRSFVFDGEIKKQLTAEQWSQYIRPRLAMLDRMEKMMSQGPGAPRPPRGPDGKKEGKDRPDGKDSAKEKDAK